MKWFKQRRVEWIIEMAAIYGYINRDHIRRKFGVSTPQASLDIADALSQTSHLQYDRSGKRYVWTGPAEEN
ncbi:MAG: hypothetical protein H6883_07035 [Rhodobiaceae bacterium]|nr:hypothetical protein [Rhodobiaceae bacterium]MCC0055874.1 hypothetical protein [Rhodobiaceae bacterium]